MAEFRDASLIAPIGEVYSEIVETQFGFHVMLVTDRVEPTEEELPTEEDVVSRLKIQSVGTQLQVWFLQQMESSQVTVDEDYGTWTANPPGVTPPPA